jgi:hypothetical protein
LGKHDNVAADEEDSDYGKRTPDEIAEAIDIAEAVTTADIANNFGVQHRSDESASCGQHPSPRPNRDEPVRKRHQEPDEQMLTRRSHGPAIVQDMNLAGLLVDPKPERLR